MEQKVIIFDARFNGELKRLAIQASKEESYWVGIVLSVAERASSRKSLFPRRSNLPLDSEDMPW